MTKW